MTYLDLAKNYLEGVRNLRLLCSLHLERMDFSFAQKCRTDPALHKWLGLDDPKAQEYRAPIDSILWSLTPLQEEDLHKITDAAKRAPHYPWLQWSCASPQASLIIKSLAESGFEQCLTHHWKYLASFESLNGLLAKCDFENSATDMDPLPYLGPSIILNHPSNWSYEHCYESQPLIDTADIYTYERSSSDQFVRDYYDTDGLDRNKFNFSRYAQVSIEQNLFSHHISQLIAKDEGREHNNDGLFKLINSGALNFLLGSDNVSATPFEHSAGRFLYQSVSIMYPEKTLKHIAHLVHPNTPGGGNVHRMWHYLLTEYYEQGMSHSVVPLNSACWEILIPQGIVVDEKNLYIRATKPGLTDQVMTVNHYLETYFSPTLTEHKEAISRAIAIHESKVLMDAVVGQGIKKDLLPNTSKNPRI